MESKKFYIISILKTLGIAVLALLIASWMSQGTGASVWVFAAIPFGWGITSKLCSGIVAFGFIGIIIYVVALVCLSTLIGWPVMLYRLGKDVFLLVKTIVAEKKMAVA